MLWANFQKLFTQIKSQTPKKGDKYIEFFKPFLEKLKATVSEELYNQFEEIFTTCVVENNKYYAVEGMKLAIGIMDGSYIPF